MRALDDRRGEDGAIEYCKHQKREGEEKTSIRGTTKKQKQSAIKCLTSSQARGVYQVVSRGREEKQSHMICMRKRSF